MYFAKKKNALVKLCFSLALSSLIFSHIVAADEQSLNRRFLELSHASLIAQAKSSEPQRFQNLVALKRELDKFHRQQQIVPAAVTLIANVNLVYQDINNGLVPDLTWFLYSLNVKTSADAIVDYASANADPFSLAKIQLQQAKYFFIIGDWRRTIDTLSGVDAFSALSEQDANYSYVIRGIALQQLKHHRQAIQYYERVNSTSRYYSTALLNSAVANIRQGWWSDAHVLLHKAIASETKNGDPIFVDRLNLTLGFSQLQNEFYRDARDTFRSIGLESPHVNRAMMGIAIAAMHQQDFIGALNMLKALREKTGDEPSIHEAYLLMPFVYEEIDQLRLAAANYNQAEAHFNKLAATFEQQALQVNEVTVLERVDSVAPSLLEYTDTTAATPQLDPLTRLNIKLLKNLILLDADNQRRNHMQTLQDQYIQSAITAIKAQLDEQFQVYNSYLSQTRFALASLYDK